MMNALFFTFILYMYIYIHYNEFKISGDVSLIFSPNDLYSRHICLGILMYGVIITARVFMHRVWNIMGHGRRMFIHPFCSLMYILLNIHYVILPSPQKPMPD